MQDLGAVSCLLACLACDVFAIACSISNEPMLSHVLLLSQLNLLFCCGVRHHKHLVGLARQADGRRPTADPVGEPTLVSGQTLRLGTESATS